MYILKSESKDAFFNVALEEYLLNNYEDDFFIIAINEPSIIIGANQSTTEEINSLYVKMNNIKVVRRLSGGGAVFQDEGNLNFSCIYKDEDSSLIDFSKVSDLISEFFNNNFDVEAKFSGRNDVAIEGKKVSGQARFRFKNKILHHGTMLLSSNKKCLTDSLKFNPDKYFDRTLSSNHERMTNLNEHLSESISIEKFKQLFLNFIRNRLPESPMFNLSQKDIDAVNELVKNKYSTWDWNYGSELDYNFTNCIFTKAGSVCLYLKTDNITIQGIRIFGDFFAQKPVVDLESALIEKTYDEKSIRAAISDFDLNYYMEGIDIEDFIKCFFKEENQ